MLGSLEISVRHISNIGASLWIWYMDGSIFRFTWKELENVQKFFLMKFLKVKPQMAHIILLLET